MSHPYTLSHCFPMLEGPDVMEAQEFYRDKLDFHIVEAWNHGVPPNQVRMSIDR